MSGTTVQTYLSAQGLADLLGVSRDTVYRNRRRWPHSLVGDSIKFSPEDVENIKALIRVIPAPVEPVPSYTPQQLGRARKRLGLPERRTAA